MESRSQLYIGGAWVDPVETGRITVENPATGEPIATIPEGGAADVDRAVAAARAAFPTWAGLSRAERRDYLVRVRDALAARQEEIGRVIATDVGTPLRIATKIQASLPITDLGVYIDALAEPEREERVGNTIIAREPAGVVAAITPWNYPLHQITCKIAPALAAGCTVVLKPSEVAPLTAFILMDVIDEAGLPAGAVNLVTGYGPQVGEALVTHPEVDVVSFTGSVPTGTRVAALAAASVKRVTLELGGKSANVILDDADLAVAVKVGVANAFLNGGQTCTAWTRMLVPAERHDEAVALAKAAAETYLAGDPLDPATRLGPLVSAGQKKRVLDYIQAGIDSGATLVTGGLEDPTRPDGSAPAAGGHFVRATVFANVDPDSVIAQEEIFGPVLSIIPFTDEADALAIANNSAYGLHGAVWSADQDRAIAFARRVRTGQVDVNGAAHNPRAPFGGYKHSGIGREMGLAAMDEFTETKSIQV
ncbi:MAG: aldehyde dehydrogenase family protein [Intrasporangium sp.]|uniref:aldehyde dehydrogenase family protein n=1 Tax=Intrasporangium sp. TaxID=1925024 RepID=UPI002647570B|nr:aldehyde dehydrogenase family protein [Intrasporangium sp.]MDN5794368.1 aldehyde dehydrogenase family protein [Intrasporangium sp.]